MNVIAIIGSKGSGKTTTAQTIIKGLNAKGYKVAAIKHIHEDKFTIDTEGKDTWIFAKAGAKKIISVAPKEIAILKKDTTKNYELEEILEECKDADVIVVEGFRKLVMNNPHILKIAAVKNLQEIEEFSKHFHPLIAFTGLVTINNYKLPVPYVDVLKEPEALIEIIESKLKKKREI
jgi:molybdopterin-guanine dinucleotide biosynthesis protein MobB